MTLAIYASADDTDPAVLLDVTTEASHERRWDYTQNPIEDGSELSDHYLSRPLQIRFRGLLSTQRPYLAAADQAISLAKLEDPAEDISADVKSAVKDLRWFTGPQQSMLELVIKSADWDDARPYANLDKLLDLEGQLVGAVTPEGFFEDLVLTQLSTRARGDAIEVSGELAQISLGWTAETADVPLADKKKTRKKRRGTKRVGKKEAPKADTATEEKASSFLTKLIGDKRLEAAKAALGGT